MTRPSALRRIGAREPFVAIALAPRAERQAWKRSSATLPLAARCRAGGVADEMPESEAVRAGILTT